MANEFIIKNGFVSRGASIITGSVSISGSLTSTNAATVAFTPGLTGANTKVSVSGSGGASTQPIFGSSETYQASGSVKNGQVVVYRYSGTTGIIKAGAATTVPDVVDIIGVALNDASNDEEVTVLTSGTCTVRRTSTFANSSETYAMPNNGTPPTNNTRNLTNNTTFTDDGGASGNYDSGQNYWATFDVGTGTEHLIMNPTGFEFESTYNPSTRLYDRLSILVSNDDVTFTQYGESNTQTGIPWLQKMKSYTNSSDWSRFPSNGDYNDAGSKFGGTFPNKQSNATANNGGTSVLGTDWHITSDGTSTGTRYRYVRFNFYSDSGGTEDGWNLTLKPSTPYTSGAENVAVGALLYIDNTDFSLLTLDSTSGRIVGKCIYSDANDDSLKVRLIF